MCEAKNMEQKKIWLEEFKKLNHRNPTIDEVKEAAKNDFTLTVKQSSQSDLDDLSQDVVSQNPLVTPATEWREKFKLTNGRLPSIDEMRVAKENGFQDTETISKSQPTPKGVPSSIVRKAKQPMATGKKVSIVTGIVIAVVVISLISWGNKYYSKSASANRTLKILQSENATQYAANFVWSDTKKKMSTSEITPFVNEISDSSWSIQRKNEVYNQLISENNANGFVFKQVGKKFLIFPNYKLTVNPVNIKVSTNNKDILLKMNSKKIGTSDSNNYSKLFKHQASGFYKFAATGKVSGQNVATTDERIINNNAHVNLAIDMISFDVNSNLSSGDLYVGSTKIGTLTDGLLHVKDVPISKGAKAYVQEILGSQTVRTKKVSLQNLYDGESIDLNAKGLMTEEDANSTLSSMYSALGSYSSMEKDPDDLTMFKNGANNKAYQDFKEMIHHNLHESKRNAESVSFSTPDVTSVKQTSLTKADAVYQVKIDFYYSSSTDEENDTYGDVTQTYEMTAHMVYDKRNDIWQIESIDPNQKKISEDDNVS